MRTNQTYLYESEPLAVAYLASVPHYEQGTRDSIRYALNRLIAFLRDRNRRVQDATPADLEELRLELYRQLAESTQGGCLGNVKRFYRWLEETHRVFLNPAMNLVIPRCERKLPQVPTEDEIARVLAQPDTGTLWGLRDRAMLEVLYSTGARRAELAKLTLDDVDLCNGTVRLFGKGKKERIVPLGKMAVHWLCRYVTEARPKQTGERAGNALWLGKRRKAIGAQMIAIHLRLYARKAGLSPSFFSPHAFRRACATHMLQHGAHPVMLHQLLGHSRLKTLSPYLRLTIQDLIATHRNSNLGE